MKNNAIAGKQGLYAAVAMILTGSIAVIFFGLALIGVAISPDILGNLPPVLVTVAFFAGSVLLLRRGMRRLKQHRSSKAWDGDLQTSANAATRTVEDTATAATATPAATSRCESCGAVGAADENGCCEYCGMTLK